LVVELCTLAGLAAGFWWAFTRPTPGSPEACSETASGAVGKCFGDSLFANVLPYLAAMGGGMIAGLVVGACLVRHLPGLRERRLDRRADKSGRWITARYVGTCHSCSAPIVPGDRIHHAPRRTSCAACGAL
jgi:hypothetical protein